MARIIGGIAASHTPTIGFAYDRNKRDYPVWAPIFENFAPLAAWLVYRIDKAGAPKWLRNALLVLVGYGPLLCAIAFAAIIAQLRKADLKWDKTIKSGKAKIQV